MTAGTTITDRRPALRRTRLAPADMVRVGSAGLRSRPTRILLSALGIAIGIAAMISVVGISSSSREDFNRQIAELGTNLLTVSPGQSLLGEAAQLPDESVAMIDNLDRVEVTSAVGVIPGAKVYRNDKVPKAESGGIAVMAAQLNLIDAVSGKIAVGSFLNEATAHYPAVVLGAVAADRLGVGSVGPDQQVFLAGQWFTVVGILAPAPLAPELDVAALVGWSAAGPLGFDGHPTTVYAVADPSDVTTVQGMLARAANPVAPNEVDVSRPSDALAAKHAADATLNALLLGLGSVALLVGGIGVANTMIISVLERRGEIGLRRSLGATRAHIRGQFLTEALLLSALGGIGGLFLGIVVTTAYATVQGWPTVVPPWSMALGFAVTLAIGGIAGLYPATRAATLPPTEALAVP
ncbi:MAG: ABC transporter permease [Actinomycetota bacterium]|nr:MAG: ABC transporter permease [Actinomycetota bacterium]